MEHRGKLGDTKAGQEGAQTDQHTVPEEQAATDASTAAALFANDAEFQVDEAITWKGPAAIEAELKQKFAEFKGFVRAELGQLNGTPVLMMWQYAKGGEKKVCCLVRTGRLRGWQIHKAHHDVRPAQIKEAQPSGLMPFDSAFMFDARDCIRTKETAYTTDGGLAILYGQLAPEGSVVKTAGISDAFKNNCGPAFVFEGPCVIFESQDDACEGILAGKDLQISDRMLNRLKARSEGLLEPDEIRRIRKKLRLTQEAAGLMIGGGPRAFYTFTNMDSQDIKLGMRWLLQPEQVQPMYQQPLVRKG